MPFDLQAETFKNYNELVSGLREVCEQLKALIGDIVPQLLSMDIEQLQIDSPFQVQLASLRLVISRSTDIVSTVTD